MKKIICLLLALVMVLGLAACGGGSKGTTVTMIAAQYGPKTWLLTASPGTTSTPWSIPVSPTVRRPTC